MLTLLKLLVIKHVTTGARATSDPVKGKQNNKNKNKTQHTHKKTTNRQKKKRNQAHIDKRAEFPGTWSTLHGVASPQPAAFAMCKGQAEHRSGSFLVPHHRASVEHAERNELQINAVDASAIPSGISTCWSNLHGDETWKKGQC